MFYEPLPLKCFAAVFRFLRIKDCFWRSGWQKQNKKQHNTPQEVTRSGLCAVPGLGESPKSMAFTTSHVGKQETGEWHLMDNTITFFLLPCLTCICIYNHLYGDQKETSQLRSESTFHVEVKPPQNAIAKPSEGWVWRKPSWMRVWETTSGPPTKQRGGEVSLQNDEKSN